MKKFIPLIIIPFIICPAVCFSSYLIELNNGSKFITYQYWEEGSQIKFYYSGGVVGIPKDSIFKISESEKEFREEMESIEIAPEDKLKKKINFEYYKNKNLQLKAKLNEAIKRIRESSKNKDLEAKNKAREDMRKISGQIYDLADELKEKNNGVLPDDWW